MRKLIFLVLAAILWAASAQALPLFAHRALNTVVQSIDYEKHLVVLELRVKDSSTEFLVEEGRTRLRRDQQPATLKDLKIGQKVRIYYKRENNQAVATEITWSSSL